MNGVSVRVTKRLAGFELDTSWVVPDGFTVLFGYSGAGKSLTLSCLAGTMRPDSGRVRIGDETLYDSASGVWVPPQQRRVGLVTQGAQLFPHMTLSGNIDYALKGVPGPERRTRVAHLLERMGIADLAERRPHEVSGGQRQRGALARAIASEPRILLLDEPLSALDLPVRVEMRELLREVQRDSGIPVVMVTHDLYEAAELADTLVVYSGDGAVQVGSTAELIGDPGTPAIRRLLHAAELPASALSRRGPVAGRMVPLDRKGNVA